MADRSERTSQAERLTLIRELWIELESVRDNPALYRALIKLIRKHSDAFRAALDESDS